MKQIIAALPGPLSPGAECSLSASPWAGGGTASSTSSHRSRLQGVRPSARRALTLSGPIQSRAALAEQARVLGSSRSRRRFR